MDDPRLASSRLHADVERLKAQVGLSWAKELQALARIGLRDGMAILEVGSGPGFFSEALLQALPHCTVTAVELDPAMCAFARRHLADHLEQRYEIVQDSILQTDLPDDAFDFAIARFVLQHVAAPDLALLEILRLLRPAGRLAILDVDDSLGGILRPQAPAFKQVGRAMAAVQSARGGDRNIGRKLWRLLAQAGYADPGLDALVFHTDELGLEPFLPQYEPARYRPFILPDGLTPAEWKAYAHAYEQFVASADAYILQLVLLASGTKPVG
jgi:ubiquinone/menaquinone biosynthesis C-methylase UbiE